MNEELRRRTRAGCLGYLPDTVKLIGVQGVAENPPCGVPLWREETAVGQKSPLIWVVRFSSVKLMQKQFEECFVSQ